MKQNKVQYTAQQISNGLDVLGVKIGRLAVAIEILTPYFKDRKINGKDFILPQSLVIVLGDVLKFHYGQLYRCYFDTQGRENNTASISVLYEQIFNDETDGVSRQKSHQSEFKEIEGKLESAQKYKDKLRQFSHKHFAHTDTGKTLEESEKELATIGIPWNEFINLINDAKIILKSMCAVCQKPSPDFAEGQYSYLRSEFWEAVKYTEVRIMNSPPPLNDGS